MTYNLSIKARNDLQNIWLYTFENWSLEQADKYVGLLLTEMEHHATDPGKGIDRSLVKSGYKCFQVKSHVIFYRIVNDKTEIEVIRILHKRMDIENRLRD